jgi:hypothetical protein
MAPPRPTTLLLALAAAALLLTAALAGCPNSCNGHGRCVGVSSCECFGAWTGGDCSERRCATGAAWADAASSTDTAHAPGAVCSNRGRCNARSGECECEQGFEGEACERMTCPLGCDAHGTCDSMRRHAQAADVGALSSGPGAAGANPAAQIDRLADPNSYTRFRGAYPYDTAQGAWDADMVHGCTCDAGYAAWDCAERACPLGDDPLTTGQVDELQLLRCDLDPQDPRFQGDQFTLSFRGAVTRAFSPRASASDLKALLEQLPTVGSVDVEFDGGAGSFTFCDARFAGSPTLSSDTQPASGNIVRLTFMTEHGELPRVSVLDQAARPLYGAKDNAVYTAAHGELLVRTVSVDPLPVVTTTVASVSGTKESVECSGRGLCDRRSGLCQCFSGFTGSNGRGARGTIADCGFAFLPVTSCPTGGGGIECSGHGTCAGYPSYACACFVGWQGGAGDCSRRSCPLGRAWFDVPSAPNTAHALAECSNKGTCLRASGRCACQEMFEGEACERMTCPGSGGGDGVECSGHGQCLPMAELAALATTALGDPAPTTYGADPNNALTWDAGKVRGCFCDAGWRGFDCSERSCPFGNDITLLEADPTRLDELQYLRCVLADPSAALPGAAPVTFALSFRGARTRALPFSASAAQVQAALQALPTVGRVDVTYSRNSVAGSPDHFCLPAPYSQQVYFAFHTQHGDLPPLRVAMDEASQDPETGAFGQALGFLSSQLVFSGGNPASDFGHGALPPPNPLVGPPPLAEFRYVPAPSYPASGIRALELRKGASGNDECSARGVCDRERGGCRCFLGFGASDGDRGPGPIEDCGWREPVLQVRGHVRGRGDGAPRG